MQQAIPRFYPKLSFKKNFIRNGVTNEAMLSKLLTMVDKLYEFYSKEQMFNQCMQYFYNPYIPHEGHTFLYDNEIGRAHV